MTTQFTIVDGYSGLPLTWIAAETASEAARLGHAQFRAESKEPPPEGWSYEEHSARWGMAADRSQTSGNGAQSYDDCLLVFRGIIEAELDVREAVASMEDNGLVMVVRPIPPVN